MMMMRMKRLKQKVVHRRSGNYAIHRVESVSSYLIAPLKGRRLHFLPQKFLRNPITVKHVSTCIFWSLFREVPVSVPCTMGSMHQLLATLKTCLISQVISDQVIFARRPPIKCGNPAKMHPFKSKPAKNFTHFYSDELQVFELSKMKIFSNHILI